MTCFLTRIGFPAVAVIAATLFSMSATAQVERIPLDSIHRSARQVMEHNEFRSVRRRVLERVPETDLDEGFLSGLMQSIGTFLDDTVFTWIGAFFRFLGDLLPDWGRNRSAPTAPDSSSSGWSWGAGFDLPRLLVIFILMMILAVIIWLVARIAQSRRNDPARGGIPDIGDTPLELTVPPGEFAASTYETRAISLAEKGDFAAAIRELLLGSMSWIERAGLIRFRKGLTNRDYVRAVWRLEERRDAYLITGSDFERVYFGRRTATSEMFAKCLTAFQGAFREEANSTPATV